MVGGVSPIPQMRERRWGRAEEQAERLAYPRQHRPGPALGLINQLVPPFGQIQGSGIVGVILASASCPHPGRTRMAQCPEPLAPSRSQPTRAEEREHPLSRAPRACSHSCLSGGRSPGSLHPHFVPWVGHQHSTKQDTHKLFRIQRCPHPRAKARGIYVRAGGWPGLGVLSWRQQIDARRRSPGCP